MSRTSLPAFEAYTEVLRQIWSSRQVTNNGPLVIELEKSLERYLGVDHLILVSNGTLAIQLVLKAMNVTGSVITTPYSYVATTTTLLWADLQPIFVDIDRTTCCLDAELVERAIKPDTTAILATHVYGFPCQHQRLREIADKHGLALIYDGAHAFGVVQDGSSIFNKGDMCTLSFHATKVYHAIEGGAIVCQTPEQADTLRKLRSFGHVGDDHHLPGINAKMSELHAGVGLLNLQTIDEQIAERRTIFESYRNALAPFRGHLRLMEPPVYSNWNYAYLVIILNSLKELRQLKKKLEDINIFPRRYFYPSLNTLPYLPAEKDEACHVSVSLSERVLCLPFYCGLDPKVINDITNVLHQQYSLV